MVLSLARFAKSLKEFPAIFKQYALIFVITHLINIFFTQSMIYLQELRMTSKDDVYIPLMMILALVGFVVQIIIRTAWTFMVCHFYSQKQSLQEFLRQHLELGLIETLRAFFKSVLWGFLLILPGFHRYFQYQFVLYTVGLDPRYQKGEIDALEESKKISRGRMIALSVLLIVFGLTGLLTASGYSVFDRPLYVLLIEAFSFFVMILQTIYFLHLFNDIQSRSKATT